MRIVSPIAAMMALLVVIAAASTAAGAPRPVDLRVTPRHLPYAFRNVMSMPRGLYREGGWLTYRLYADTERRGIDDVFRPTEVGIVGSLRRDADLPVEWQTNLPVAFSDTLACASLDGAWDVDGDGRAEVVATAHTGDGARWRITVLDASTGEPEHIHELAGGIDHRPDGHWDGAFRVFGPLRVPTPAGVRPALLVGMMAGFDLQPRGMQAIDLVSGDVLWQYLVGPKPVAITVRLVDLDGDSRPEICFIGSGVDNLGGRPVNGTSDDQARLFVLGEDGGLRWSRPLGVAPASGCLGAVDVDGDGDSELVLAAIDPDANQNTLVVLDGDGTTLAATGTGTRCGSLGVTGDPAGGALAYLALDGRLRRYRLSRDRIVQEADAVTDGVAGVSLIADLTPEAGEEILVYSQGEWNWMLGADLQPLAVLHDHDYAFLQQGIMLNHVAPGQTRIVTLGDPQFISAEFDVVPVPKPVPWAWLAAGVGVTGTAALGWYRRARRLSTAAVRGLRLQILDRLWGASHGAIGALSAPERLMLLLESAESGLIGGEVAAGRLEEFSRDFLQAGLPDLTAALELAGLARLDPEAVAAARTALSRLQAQLEQIRALPAAGIVAGEHSRELRDSVKSTGDAFRVLRRAAGRAFSADPREVIERSLRAHDDDIARSGIELVVGRHPAPACRVDAEELAFVVDNLIGNAVRAMAASETRRLMVNWRVSARHVVISVADTGCGMTPDQATAALVAGADKREGGGHGLPGSRRQMEKYSGALVIAATEPGAGTTMELTLPRHEAETAAVTAEESAS